MAHRTATGVAFDDRDAFRFAAAPPLAELPELRAPRGVRRGPTAGGRFLLAEEDCRFDLTFEPERLAAAEAAEVKPKRNERGNFAFRGVAHSGAIMVRQTWDGPMAFAIDMSSLRFTRQDVPILKDHDGRDPVGFTSKLSKDGNKLAVVGELIDANDAGREVVAFAERGMPWQMSVYVPPASVTRLGTGEEAKVNGQTMKGPGVILRGCTLREVTVTTLGADEQTGGALFGDGVAGRSLEVALERAQETIVDETETNVATAAPTITAPAPSAQASASAAAPRAAAPDPELIAERARFADVQRIAAQTGAPAELTARAISEGWDAGRFAVEAINAAHLEASRAQRLALVRGAHADPVGTADPTVRNGVTRFRDDGRAVDGAPSVPASPERRNVLLTMDRLREEFGSAGFEGVPAAELQAEFGLLNAHGEEEHKRALSVYSAYRRNPWKRGSKGAVATAAWRDRFAAPVRRYLAEGEGDPFSFGISAALSPRQVRGEFFKRIEETQQAGWIGRISHMFRTDQGTEQYRFLGQIPAVREWIGQRSKNEPRDFRIDAINKKYEGSVQFSKDDERRDRTGQIAIRTRDLGSRIAQLPAKTVTAVLAANGTAYDGIAYFGNHTSGPSSKVNNAQVHTFAAVATPTSAEMAAAILKTVRTLLGALDEHSEPLNEFASAFLVMVPTDYWDPAVAALGNLFTSAGVSNTLSKMIESGKITVELVANARMAAPAGTGVFYTFRTDSDVKPLIWQDEVDIDLDFLGDGSDLTWNYDVHAYGAKRIGTGVLGAYEMACRLTAST